MENKKTIRIIAIVVAMAIIGILSFTVAGEKFSSPETYKGTIEILDEKRNTVTGISGTALAASAAVAAVPGDSTTPIANELANLATTCLLIVVAIIAEKYIMILSGLLTFKILIPIACILIVGYAFSKRQILAKLAAKLVLFGLCFVLLVPVSTQITQVIDDTHKMSVTQNMEDTDKFIDELKENEKEEKGVFGKIASAVKNSVFAVKEKAEAIVSNLIEAIAVMIVTSCVIPLLTLWAMTWIARTILGIQVNIPVNKIKAITRRNSKEKMMLEDSIED